MTLPIDYTDVRVEITRKFTIFRGKILNLDRIGLFDGIDDIQII